MYDGHMVMKPIFVQLCSTLLSHSLCEDHWKQYRQYHLWMLMYMTPSTTTRHRVTTNMILLKIL